MAHAQNASPSTEEVEELSCLLADHVSLISPLDASADGFSVSERSNELLFLLSSRLLENVFNIYITTHRVLYSRIVKYIFEKLNATQKVQKTIEMRDFDRKYSIIRVLISNFVAFCESSRMNCWPVGRDIFQIELLICYAMAHGRNHDSSMINGFVSIIIIII